MDRLCCSSPRGGGVDVAQDSVVLPTGRLFERGQHFVDVAWEHEAVLRYGAEVVVNVDERRQDVARGIG